MNPIFKLALVLFVIYFGIGSVSANSDTRTIRSALFCLTRSDIRLLGPVSGRSFAVIVTYGDTSSPAQRDLLLFIKRDRDRYDAFVIVVSGRIFDVQNNATLKAGRRGVVYLDDPLGGIWTRTYLAAQFVRALKQRPIVVSSDALPNSKPLCRLFGKSVKTD